MSQQPHQSAEPEITSSSLFIREVMTEEQLLSRLRSITLLNQTVRPYASARIWTALVEPELLFPAAFYVVAGHVERQRRLRTALLAHRFDTLDLAGGVEFQLGESVWTVIPPVVEFQPERVEFHPLRPSDRPTSVSELSMPLINDGLHRVWLARELGRPVRVVLIAGALRETPYYAYPTSWSRVQLVERVPTDTAARKVHRTENHYGLYRDFGPLGVGKPRHPDEIRPLPPPVKG